MKRIICFILVLLTVSAPLCGCLSPVSLDVYGYVISIGVDRGKDKRYYITFALQREMQESNTQTEGGADILACEGDCLDEAKAELEGRVPYSLSFSRMNFFIFSEETARSGDIEDFLSITFDAEKIRTSAVAVISKGKAYEFIGGLSANNDANITKLQTAVMLDMEKNGMVTLMSVSRLFEAVETGVFDYCAPMGRMDPEVITDMEQKKAQAEGKDPLEKVETGDTVGGLKSDMDGTALFSGWIMTGELTRDETAYLNMANGEFKNGTVSVPFGGSRDEGTVTVLLTMDKMKRSMISGARPSVVVNISLKAGVHKKPVGLGSDEMNEWIMTHIPGYIEERLAETFEKCREAGSDAMRFGTDAVKLMKSRREYEAFDKKEFINALEVRFKVEITNTDKLMSGEHV